MKSPRTAPRNARKILTAVSILAAVLMACNLPFMPAPTPGPDASTATPQAKIVSEEPLPPVVVETSPLPSGVLPLAGGVTLTFDQPMDRPSVEAALKIEPALPGRFQWTGDTAVSFVPDQPLPAETQVTVSLADSARSAQGLNLLRSTSYNFETSGPLRVTEILPKPGTADANPSSTIAVTFNQPVVVLGEGAAPQAFTLEPAVEGRGSWLNTSTYIFEADPALGGGVQYRVRLNPDLTSLTGAGLDQAGALDWEFTTTPPALLTVVPEAFATVGLDQGFSLTFNQPMDTSSVEANFSLEDAVGNPVSGTAAWTDRDTVMTFTPAGLLRRGNSYTLNLSNNARSRGGTTLPISTSLQFHTVGQFSVASTEPAQGKPLTVFYGMASILLAFNSPLGEGQQLDQLVQFEPKPGNLSLTPSDDRKNLYISGSFLDATGYRATLSSELADRWGSTLGAPVIFNFRVANSEPALQIPMVVSSGRTLFAVPGETSLPAYAVNLGSLGLSRTGLDLKQFLNTVYDSLNVDSYSRLERWEQTLSLPPNTSQPVAINLTPNGEGLTAGFYLYRVTSPQLPRSTGAVDFAMVVSPLQVTLKHSATSAFVWVTDLRSGKVVPDTPVELYTSSGDAVASGMTGGDGTLQLAVPKERESYPGIVAVAGDPASENFGIAISSWAGGIEPWALGISAFAYQPELQAYIYTDRPIYRPGQTVFFRAVLRSLGDARYAPTSLTSAEFKLLGGYDVDTGLPTVVDDLTLDLSPYGTVNGQIALPADLKPGYYTLQLVGQAASLGIQVADYRKPEIELQVDFSQPDYRSDQPLTAQVRASYYFGGAASNVSVRWSLYAQNETFNIPGGFTTGTVDTGWLNRSWTSFPGSLVGSYVTGGTAVTDADGILSLTFDRADLADKLDLSNLRKLTLQAELTDETGQTVSRRGSTRVHPDDFYIGVKPDSWVSKSGESIGFSLQTSDWQASPAGGRSLTAVFQRVEWVQDWSNPQTGQVRFKEQTTEIGSVNLTTDASGQARIAFNVDAPGSYRLDIRGGKAVSQALVWAGGAGSVPWPDLPDQHIQLQSGQTDYKVGDTAQIFVPNPFSQGALGLLTIERGSVIKYQVIDLTGSSATVDVSILPEDAPNVYVSMLLLGQTPEGRPDFRIGYLELKVDPAALVLKVNLAAPSAPMEPGQTAELDLQVLDSSGNPVQGEFSAAVVDKAIFALADPNAPDIVSAFYGPRLLGVFTSSSLAASTQRTVLQLPGVGGGGGGDQLAPPPLLRRDFQDTAYWNGAFETDANGRASIEFPLPDNLTTWVVTVRGLTSDTRVGEAAAELLVTRDLIIRPVTPRFLTAGDRVQLGAVVNNNTSQNLAVNVNLQAAGVVLEDPASAAQSVQVAPGGRERVNWWVKVPDAGEASLVFTARSGDLQDSSTPVNGNLPILRYVSPQLFTTSGLMTSAGENLEVVSLPPSYQPTGGELRVEMSSTLAGTVISSLDALESYPSDLTEPVISHLLANLAAYRLQKETGTALPELAEKLPQVVGEDLVRLRALVNSKGGFAWSKGSPGDLYLTSYGLMALALARQAGFMVPTDVLQSVQQAVSSLLLPVEDMEDWQLDQTALAYYALSLAGDANFDPQPLFPLRERLSPWGKALLAETLASRSPEEAKTLLSDLQGLALRSASGVNWQDAHPAWQNYSTPNFTTAVVVYALAGQDPASPQLADAVRYLTAHRLASGGWYSSYDSAWVLMALTRYLQATGELAGSFAYSAALNGAPLASGQAGAQNWNVVRAAAPLSDLYPSGGNALSFVHGSGEGRLYYRAFLEVGQPVDKVQPVNRGLSVYRDYLLAGAACRLPDCPAVDTVSLSAENPVVVGRLTLTLPTDQYYVVVRDAIPAGAEVIDLNLNMAPFVPDNQPQPQTDPLDPFASGWGWWRFSSPAITDTGIEWIASYLPAGTYTLTYKLQPLHAGAFQVLPARAYNYFFPEVEGSGAGTVFNIEP